MKRFLGPAFFLATVLLPSWTVAQQEPAPPTATPPAAGEGELIQLNFPENLEVKLFVDYVSQRLGLNILYDESVIKKRVTIVAPTKVPKDSLLGLLQSVLKMTGLALVDADQPGWQRVISSQELLSATKGFEETSEAFAKAEATTVITQIFTLKNTSTSKAEQTIKPFLSKPGGNTFSMADRRMLFVTDYADSLARVARLIELLDVAAPEALMRFVAVEHWEADELARRVTALLAEKQRVTQADKGKQLLKLTSEPRTNQIVIISVEGAAAEAEALIKLLDVPTDAETRTYRLVHVAPQRIDRLARDFAGKAERYKSTLDAESGLLIVTAPPAVHDYVQTLAAQLDVPPTEEQSHVRFYKLMNTTAIDVLATVRSLVSGMAESGLTDLSGLAMDGSGPTSPVPPAGTFTGPNQPPGALGRELPKPPPYKESRESKESKKEGNEGANPDEDDESKAGDEAKRGRPGAFGSLTARTADAIVTADPNTNTIIVIAPPAVQALYGRLITMLDKRRPQVMIEATLVTLDTSDNFAMGIELSKADAVGNSGTYLTFSSFGLAAADPVTGALTLQPGVGFNGVLLDPDAVNVVLRALATEGRSEVLSAPRVLVNDNATASLSSVAEAPFTSVNASDTVATTSFAGYASAGTTISVTPHISEGDHLLLQYSLTLNSFTGAGAAGIPPPRQTNTLSSEVTIPDGYTIIVGGLNRRDLAETISKIPLLGDIPLLGYLFSNRTINEVESTLFVFIRPVVLRDDKFEDLKYLSKLDRKLARLPEEIPASEPLLMH